ncbi:hypothetical protein SAMN06273572_101463 [Monaibacterium marinum]|uniref:VOC domain-containing protein n=1 Tax=Pontivivens marinum TaxID=1690039 RepID=A0A2C9CN50_9RHOB|nr:VOC family protein [Monaibacterium marinum]SOH92615.1 hypothetical protein SAMN06273572_101463 [Monaibacterium marinum]
MSDHHGTIFWTELATRDVAAAREYYAATCGWTYDEMTMQDGGTYVTAMKGEQMVCGIFDMSREPMMAELPPHWSTYIGVEDVDQVVAQAAKRGATVIRPAWDIPHVGRIAIIADPSGAPVGIMTPSE